MPYPQFDRTHLHIRPLGERRNQLAIERNAVTVDAEPKALSAAARGVVRELGARMRQARAEGCPNVLAFGAHTIKNGLGPVLIRLLEEGWVQHLATNGASIIHDWEFAYQGETGEDVRAYVAEGQFGIWEDTGFNLNLALLLGAVDGLGYGEAIGRLIEQDAHHIPSPHELRAAFEHASDSPEAADLAAAAADLLGTMARFELSPGRIEVHHPWKRYSAQAAAYRLGIPFTAHPMIGHDIIYTHPLNHCAAVGRTAQRDFLAYAHQISNIDGGVYLSIGSAVMSPMVFEKSLSMARNLARQQGRDIDRHYIAVVDLAESRRDWSQGEPPQDSPDYYLRYCKSFSRMGGTMHYATADNRDFLLALCRELEVKSDPAPNL